MLKIRTSDLNIDAKTNVQAGNRKDFDCPYGSLCGVRFQPLMLASRRARRPRLAVRSQR